jgi:hypothetical protein
MSTTSTYMGFPISTIGTDSGLNWETNLNAALNVIDQHNHSPGQGQQIQPNGLNINADLSFNTNNATLLRTTRFSPQASPIPNSGSDVGELYVSGNELYYNDVTGGNQVKITSSGSVNATSSGIASGTASAAFSAGVLLVKSSSTSFANIAAQSILLANSGNLSNQLTLAAPTLSGSITETLPAIPSSQSFMTIDTSGNMSGYASVNQGIERTNLVSVGQQISSSSGLFTTTSTTFVAVTNLSVTITTSGRPVVLMLIGDGSGGNASVIYAQSSGSAGLGAFVAIERNSSIITYQGLTQNLSSGGNLFSIETPVSSIAHLDPVSAGTYTYAVYLRAQSSSPAITAGLEYALLVAYEL